MLLPIVCWIVHEDPIHHSLIEINSDLTIIHPFRCQQILAPKFGDTLVTDKITKA
jgi:hypothetical protein